MTPSESDFAAYQAALEHATDIGQPVRAIHIGSRFEAFARRHWLIPTGDYLTHVIAPFLDGEIEVEVEKDEDACLYRYRSPQYRSRILTRPLREIALFKFCVTAWLDDLACLIGAALLEHPLQPELLPGHLWHLGGFGVGGADPAPVFVGRRWEAAPSLEVASVLADPAWPRPGIVLLQRRTVTGLSGGHQARALAEFVETREGADRFDAAAFGRVMRSLAAPASEMEPSQYLRGSLLKLPNFDKAMPLSDERLKLIKVMWGQDGTPPPIHSWAEANRTANTGYSSFDDAFAWDGLKWTDLFERVGYGKYRLRRNP